MPEFNGLLADLDRLEEERRGLVAESDRAITNLLGEEKRAEFDKLKELYEFKVGVVDTELNNLMTSIKEWVALSGEPAETKYFKVGYRRGRMLWDGEMLNSLSTRYPEINEARRTGPAIAFVRAVDEE